MNEISMDQNEKKKDYGMDEIFHLELLMYRRKKIR